MVITGAGPGARLGLVHVSVTPEGGLQVHPVPDPTAPVTPAGRVSVTVREAAVLGPALLTVIV